MFRVINNIFPNKFTKFLKTVKQIHSYDTRNYMNYVILFARTCTGYRAAAIHVLGPRLWNSLSNYFKEIKHLATFKKGMKLTYLLTYIMMNCELLFISIPGYINIHWGRNAIRSKIIILKVVLHVITLSVLLCYSLGFFFVYFCFVITYGIRLNVNHTHNFVIDNRLRPTVSLFHDAV